MLKLKLQYFDHIGKDPDAGKDWRQEDKGATEDEMVGWHHWLTDITNSCLLNMSLSKLQEIVKVREAWHAAVCGVTKSGTRLSHWTTTTHKGNPIRLTADFSAETLQPEGNGRLYLKYWMWKTYNQDYPTWQGSHSILMEKSKTLQTIKS